jgi:flagellar motility protein MotE (MotC chaperone)
MKKLLSVIAAVLALNFVSLAGMTGYLWRTGHLDRDRANQIKAILFPAPAASTAELATGGSTTQPTIELDELIKKAAGLSAEDQVAFLQRSFDARTAELDLRQRQLTDQQRQIDFGRQKLTDDRTALDAEKQSLAATEQQAQQQASDQGFQDSLQLYSTMTPKQVKTIFMTLPDDIVMRYLEAMSTPKAGKIIKEFKSPDETDRIQKVLERMRLQNAGGAQTQPAAAESLPTAGLNPTLP